MRGEDATSSINSSDQSIGSTELMRSFSSGVRSRIAAHQVLKAILRGEIPSPASQIDAGDNYFFVAAATSSSTSRTASFRSNDRLCPRVNGMMQNEQRLLQPVLHFEIGARFFRNACRLRKTGAASSSV